MAEPNAQMQLILDAHTAMAPLPIESLTPELARQIPLLDRAAMHVYGHHFMKKATTPMPLDVEKIEHWLIPGEPGQAKNILVRVYTPQGERPPAGWPVLVYFHGGGWVIGTLDTYDSTCRALAEEADCIVVSASYRQAPEHIWPAAPNDAFAAYRWVCANAKQFNADPECVAVGGESAGGNLAAVVAQMARDKGEPLPVYQLLVYPVTDLVNGTNSVSANEYANAKPLNTAMLTWFYHHYLPDDGMKRQEPYASPLFGDLNGLPPATIILAEIDPLRSDGEAYAARLTEAGVAVKLKTYAGVTHEFFGLAGLVGEASEAVAYAAQDLRDAFLRDQPPADGEAPEEADEPLEAAS